MMMGVSRMSDAAAKAKKRSLTPKKKEVFLADFADTGNVTRSARKMEISRMTVYEWIEKDPDFKTKFEAARDEALDLLEAEIQRRGFEGTPKTFYGKDGNVRSEVQEYSDTLAIFFLKGHRPDKYKDRVEQEQKGGLEITIRDLRGERENKG